MTEKIHVYFQPYRLLVQAQNVAQTCLACRIEFSVRLCVSRLVCVVGEEEEEATVVIISRLPWLSLPLDHMGK